MPRVKRAANQTPTIGKIKPLKRTKSDVLTRPHKKLSGPFSNHMEHTDNDSFGHNSSDYISAGSGDSTAKAK